MMQAILKKAWITKISTRFTMQIRFKKLKNLLLPASPYLKMK
jgi:hypothetical protein